jgi:LysR family transcriptional regulator, transcriptional activator of the cysJI operon
MLSLVPLATFRRLASEGNYTRTAEALNLTQPAVTQHVRALEAHFGVKLVDIVGRRAVLTDAGRFLASRAEAVLGAVAALERDMLEYADVRSGTLRLGATLTIGTYDLPALAGAFRALHPGITLDVAIENTERIVELVRQGDRALALVEGAVAPDEELAVMPYTDDELVVIVHPGHPAVGRGTVAAATFRDEPFVAREEGSGTRLAFERAFRRADVEPRVVLALPSGEGVVRAVEAGIGAAVLSTRVVAEALAAGRVVRVPVAGLDLRRDFNLVRLRRTTPSPAAQAFTMLVMGEKPATPASAEPRR